MDRQERPVVAVLLPEPTRAMVFVDETERRLAALADVRAASGDPARWDLAALLRGAVACVTGWGTPRLDERVLADASDLRLVVHTAGSIRRLLPGEAVGRRVQVCQAAAMIAESVAEQVVLQILSGLRELHLLDHGLRTGAGWSELRERHPGRLLGSQTVGVVGASRTGRAVIALLRAFGCRILVADPFLTAAAAKSLGVTSVEFDTLLGTSDVVTLHAPLLPETVGMIGARELSSLRDGALLVNSARADLVDADALLAELRSGRIRAALDVFPSEPLLPDSPWRQLPNVILSPHSAGHSVDSHRRQGSAMVDEIERFVTGRPLQYEVTAEMVAVLA